MLAGKGVQSGCAYQHGLSQMILSCVNGKQHSRGWKETGPEVQTHKHRITCHHKQLEATQHCRSADFGDHSGELEEAVIRQQ